MGSGVEAHESFEALLEERLNQDLAPDSSTSFEILNFGVAGYSPLHMLYQLERKVFAFEPNMAIFLGHVSDLEGTARRWARMVRSGFFRAIRFTTISCAGRASRPRRDRTRQAPPQAVRTGVARLGIPPIRRIVPRNAESRLCSFTCRR